MNHNKHRITRSFTIKDYVGKYKLPNEHIFSFGTTRNEPNPPCNSLRDEYELIGVPMNSDPIVRIVKSVTVKTAAAAESLLRS